MNAKTLVAIVTTALSVFFARADIYVDAAADPQVADGTVEHPYATIQAAVNAASSGATIRIAAGVYDQGGVAVEGSTSSRVLIQNKTLHLIGAGRGQTVICGTYGMSTYGYGPGAWRCVQVDNGDGTILEKMTLKGGATVNSSASKYNSVSGGGLLVGNSANPKSVCLVDSDIIGCRAVWGGAARSGTLVRCLLDGSLADNGLATCESRLVNCVVTRCRPTTITEGVANASELYNCTLVDNRASYALTGSSSAYGSVIILSSTVAELHESTVTECVLGQSAAKGHVQILAPALGDWRLIAGSDAVGAATASRLSGLVLPTGIDPMGDFSGKAIVATEGRIDAGALQGAVAPAAGGLYFRYSEGGSAPVIADGRTNAYAGATWVFPSVYPTQYVFTARVEGMSLCRLARTDPADGLANKSLGYVPGLDDAVRLMPPPTVGRVATNYFEFAGAEKTAWTDAENGKDDWGSGVMDAGSESHPYKTLAKAVSALGGCTSGASVIFAKPGRYDEGTMSNDYGTFRVAVAAGQYGRVRIVAVEGPEKTFIVGAPDPGSTVTGTYAGCGPNAVRGVCLMGQSDVSLQGFTLCGCYTWTEYPSRINGAAVYSSEGQSRAHIADCIISNNYAYGSVVYGGMLRRCRVIGNYAGDTVFSGARSETVPMTVDRFNGVASCCAFVSNTVTAVGNDSQGVVGGAARIYNCTFVGVPRSGRLVSGRAAYSVSSIYDGGQNVFSAARLTNSVLWNYESKYGSEPALIVDPQFARRTADDYRVRVGSPCVGAGAVVDADPYFWQAFDGAMDGALVFSADGKPTVGAYQQPVDFARVTVMAAQGGLEVVGRTVGDNVVLEGETLALRPAAGMRPCVGVAFAGETLFFMNAAGRTVTLSLDALKSHPGASVSAVYSTEWFVDDVRGNDGNTGFFSDDALKTLAVAAARLSDGDTLHVAAGVYASGSSGCGDSLARVVVPTGAKVVAAEGPVETVIRGEDGLRCAYLNLRARLSGFTLTGGCPAAGQFGGGVLGGDGQGRCLTKGILVDNCVISNNAAANGSAAARVNLIGCRVTENTANGADGDDPACLYQGSAYGSFFARNVGKWVFDYCQNIVGTSVAADNVTAASAAAGAEAHYGVSPADKARIYNSVIRAQFRNGSGSASVRNSALTENSYFGEATVIDPATSVKTSLTDLGVNADGSSLLGTFPVDAADGTLFDLADAVYDAGSDLAVFSNSLEVVKAYCCGAKDLNGNPRVYDGVQDVGCFETDWRGSFARALGRSYLTVSAASAGVRLAGVGRLTLGTDDVLSVGVTFEPDRARRVYVRARTSGMGRLEVRVGGETVAAVVAADGLAERQIVLPVGTDVFDIVFVGEGSAEVFRCRRDAGFVLIFR